MIPSDGERMFAKQMNATTILLPSSHASLVSHPNEIAQLILNAGKVVVVLPNIGDNLAYKHGLHSCQEVYP